jgi:hypothetical protein
VVDHDGHVMGVHAGPGEHGGIAVARGQRSETPAKLRLRHAGRKVQPRALAKPWRNLREQRIDRRHADRRQHRGDVVGGMREICAHPCCSLAMCAW